MFGIWKGPGKKLVIWVVERAKTLLNPALSKVELPTLDLYFFIHPVACKTSVPLMI